MSPQYLRECAAALQGFSYYRPLVAWMNAQAAAMDASFAPTQPAAVEPRCDNCKWWREIEDLRPKGVGRCMIRRPVVGIDGISAQWPRTVESEWCGEFAPRQVTP